MSVSQDHGHHQPDRGQVRLLLPVVVLVLAATAIPVERRPLELTIPSLECGLWDALANLLLYIPVGFVLARLPFWRALTLAMILSLFAETCQYWMMHRFPSISDLVLNVAGAALGLLWFRSPRSRIGTPAIPINHRTAWLSVVSALAILGLKAWVDREDLFLDNWKARPANARGATMPGRLEACWTFDELEGGVFPDSSGNGPSGTPVGGPQLAPGIHGMAVRLDGRHDYVDFGNPVCLRLLGSMTICAWINSSSFPRDDAAIVSSHSPGYQLDTTVDRGPRTIGFKLVDPWRNLIARYGATELLPDRWYHVAGVYDAHAQTLNVYLDGHPDDGFLLGTVPPAQHASDRPVCVGQRAGVQGYEFAGLIDDVCIYSRALAQAEIEAAAHDAVPPGQPAGRLEQAPAGAILAKSLADYTGRIHRPTRSQDAILPGLMVALGMLSATACAGFWPRHRLAMLGASLGVGILLVPVAAISLPPSVLWMLPPLSLMGGATVVLSVERAKPSAPDGDESAAIA